MFTTIMIGGQEYKLALTTGATLMLEKKLGGKSALSVLGTMANANTESANQFENVVPLESLLHILHASLQKFNANYSFEQACSLYDIMMEDADNYENGAYMELVKKCMEVVSGSFFGKKLEMSEKIK